MTTDVIIRNPSGLHARPAAAFVNCAKRYHSKITVSKAGVDPVNAKSIVMILSGGFGCGDTVSIHAEGEDEARAIEELTALVSSGFGEI